MAKVKRSPKAEKVRSSSGNVFADLGLSDPGERLVKAQLAIRISQVIANLKLTQTEAAKRMNLDQPKISALKQGRLKGFSIERLFRCLNDLGQDVSVTVEPAPSNHRATTRILQPS